MLTEQIENIERTAYEGLLSPSQSIAVGCLMALLAAWLLWRERRPLGAWAPVIWGFRLGAIGVALWMLAGPTHLAIQRVTSPQAIALMIDDTGSMAVSDPPAPADDLRWRLAAGADSPSRFEQIVMLCDRSGVQIAEAVLAANELSDAITEHRSSRELRPIFERAERAASATREMLVAASEMAVDENELFAERIERVLAELDEAAQPALERIDSEINSFEPAGLETLDNTAEMLVDSLSSAQRRGLSLARDAGSYAAETSTVITSAGSSRSERVDAMLAHLEEEVLARLEEKCVIHRLRFSQIASAEAISSHDAEAPKSQLKLVATKAPYLDASGGSAVSLDSQASASTDLSAALQQVEMLRSSGPLRMAVMLTDGRHNAPNRVTPREAATRLAMTPVHVTPIGTSTPVRDLLIHRVEAPTRVVHKDTATIEVMLTALDCAGEEVEVVLTRDGEEIDRRPLSITRDWQDSRVLFRIDTGKPGQDELGPREYEVEVEAVSDEASLTNNLGVAAIEVVRDKLRVLLADHGPRWEYRYLQQLFRRDKHIDFDELLMLPEPRATGDRAATGRLPRDVKGWSEYDVVILGDLGRDILGGDEQESLVEFVQDHGGSLIVIAGREHMPQTHLASPVIDLLPVLRADHITPQDGFGVALTDEARLASSVALRETFRESEAAWQAAYGRVPIYGLSPYSRPKPNARVLVEATPIGGAFTVRGDDPLAFFSWHPVGSGKVAYLSAPQSYQLRFRRGDRDHHAFWGQTLRWITAEQGAGREPVRIDTDRTQYPIGKPVEVTVWLRDPQGRPVTDAVIEVEARSLDEVSARAELRSEGEAPGRYVGSFDRLPLGAFEVVPVGDIVTSLLTPANLEAPRKLISVQSMGDIEMVDTQSDRALLEQIAELTGGQVTPPTAVAELIEVAALDPEVTESPPRRTPLWNRWSCLLIISGCLMFEWIVRKAKGLT